MAGRTKADVAASVAERTGRNVDPDAHTMAELRAMLADAPDVPEAAAAGGDGGSQVRVTRGAGVALVRVEPGASIVHGDPDAGEDRREYREGDTVAMPTAQAVELTIAGQVSMIGQQPAA